MLLSRFGLRTPWASFINHLAIEISIVQMTYQRKLTREDSITGMNPEAAADPKGMSTRKRGIWNTG